MKMTYPTCSTCRWWKVPSDGWGLCEYEMEPDAKLALIYPLDSIAEIHTRPDFGCNQHKPLDGQAPER